jgi:hypothetical protein
MKIKVINKIFSNILKDRIARDGEQNFWNKHLVLIKLLEKYIPLIDEILFYIKNDKHPQSRRFALISACGTTYQIIQQLCGLNGGQIGEEIKKHVTDRDKTKKLIENSNYKESYKNEIDSCFDYIDVLEQFQEEIYNINTILRHPKPEKDLLWIFDTEESEQSKKLAKAATYLGLVAEELFDDSFAISGYKNNITHKQSLWKIAEEHNKQQTTNNEKTNN